MATYKGSEVEVFVGGQRIDCEIVEVGDGRRPASKPRAAGIMDLAAAPARVSMLGANGRRDVVAVPERPNRKMRRALGRA